MAVLVSVWHCHRRVEWDDVIQLLEKLDLLEADDDAVWQFLEDAHTPQSEKEEALYVRIFQHFDIFCSAAVVEIREGTAEEFICSSLPQLP